jgi:hypothetical protein
MNMYKKTIPKLAAMRIGAFTCVVDGACTYPLLDYWAFTYPYLFLGLALTPYLMMGLALYPLCIVWFPVCTSEKSKSQRGSLLRV